MSRSLIPLLTLVATALGAPTSDARPFPHPGWQGLPPVEIDPTCLGAPRHDEAAQPLGQGAGGVGYGAGGAGYGTGLVGSLGSAVRGSAAPPPAPAMEVAEAKGRTASRAPAMDAANALQSMGYVSEEDGDAPAAAPKRERATAEAESRRAVPESTAFAPPAPPIGPSIDWGGTLHLSNDDAMSLASAQRVLWAVEKGQRLPAEHIRPHELLNYFTFDGVRPGPGEMVGVSASGFRDGDTLRFAVDVTAATPPRAPVDLTLLVDRSGSMSAEGRMSYTQRALRQATQQLDPGDRVDLVVFDHTVCSPVKNFVVGRDSPALLDTQIAAMSPRGSTDLDSGLREAYRQARAHRSDAPQGARSGRVMVFTDAILNTGRIDKHVVTEVGKALDQDGIRLTGVGVGKDFRDDVLDDLTEKGRGAYVFLGSEAVVDRLFGSGFDSLIHTVAEDVRFSLTLPDSLGMKTFHGEESSRDPSEVTPVMLAAGSHQVFFSDLAIRDQQLRWHDDLVFSASWTDPATGRRAGTSQVWKVGDVLAQPDRDARKAAALMAWSDLLLDRAMGGPTCGASYGTFVQAVRQVPGDAELSWVAEITGRGCAEPAPVARWSAPAHLKVRIDADQPIGAVALDCPDGHRSETLRSGDQVASFDVSPGACLVTLHGAVPMVARVDVPAQGTALSCRVRGGRVACH